MAKLIRSARGVQVDFDLVLIKQQIASSAAPTNVQSREDFIETKLRRRNRRIAAVPGAPVVAERELGEEITAASLEEAPEPEEYVEPEAEEVTEEQPVKRVKK